MMRNRMGEFLSVMRVGLEPIITGGAAPFDNPRVLSLFIVILAGFVGMDSILLLLLLTTLMVL
jgi:hypothetical protein